MSRERHTSLGVVAVIILLWGLSVAPFVWPLIAQTETVGRGPDTPTTEGVRIQPSERTYPVSTVSDSTNDSDSSENVSVAILDPQGFAVDNPKIADRVVATRSFWEGRSITNEGRNGHGTASALIVADVAPDAELYLANFNGSRGFAGAVEWAVSRDVDVIVAPVSFYGKPNDGTAVASRAVEDAADAGVPVVVPTGNLARKHWQGTYDGDGQLSFSGDPYLRLEGSERAVEVWARWNESAAEQRNLTIILLEDTGDGFREVARSHRFGPDQVGPNQVLAYRPDARLRTSVPNGTYAIAVRGESNVTLDIELYSATHRFARPDPAGSIVTPATADAPGVIAVGAAHHRNGTVEPLPSSSRGPTNDGRRGIDVIAPGVFESDAAGTIRGSSYAATYTGAVVALLLAADPGLSPAVIERIVQRTALPAGASGVDNATGYGMLNPSGALEEVEHRTLGENHGDPGDRDVMPDRRKANSIGRPDSRIVAGRDAPRRRLRMCHPPRLDGMV